MSLSLAGKSIFVFRPVLCDFLFSPLIAFFARDVSSFSHIIIANDMANLIASELTGLLQHSWKRRPKLNSKRKVGKNFELPCLKGDGTTPKCS